MACLGDTESLGKDKRFKRHVHANPGETEPEASPSANTNKDQPQRPEGIGSVVRDLLGRRN